MRHVFGDYTLFLRSVGKFGMIENVSLPDLKWKTEDFEGGGQIGTRKLGLILDHLALEFESNSYDRQMLSQGLQAPGRQTTWKILGSLIVPGEDEKPFKAVATGTLMEIERPKLQPGKKDNTKFKVHDITYYQEIVDGRTLFEIDLENQVLVVNGVDQMAVRRRNLGR